MLERSEQILKISCAALAVLFCVQLSRFAIRKDPLEIHLPILATTSAAPEAPEPKKETNAPAPARAQTRKKENDLPPIVQARIDRIIQSEIFGAVVKPILMPAALLGIAGHDAFLRAPNGQSGLLKEGQELGGIKILRIGTNRVLIEEDGKQKELTVFSGFGGETLLPKGKEKAQ